MIEIGLNKISKNYGFEQVLKDISFEYFRRKGKEKITPQFIKKVAKKYYPNMQYVLNNLEDDEINEVMNKIIAGLEKDLKAELR